MTTHELVKSVSIANLVNQRAAVASMLQRGLELLREAESLANTAHVGFPEITLTALDRRRTGWRVTGTSRSRLNEMCEAAARVIDATAWAYLMNESGLRTFMDAAARQEWDTKLHEGEVPPLTTENIASTFTSLHDARGDMFERGVVNVFRTLSWDYRTNQPFKFGKRVILRGLFRCVGVGQQRWLSLGHGKSDHLDDLDRVFHLLDSKPEPDHRNAWWQRLNSLDDRAGGERAGEYFAVRWFLNGNGHLTFKRLDLVDQMNRILAKHYPNALASKVR